MPSNLNITLEFLSLDTATQSCVQFSIWGFIRVVYISKAFSSLEIKIIQLIIRFLHDTIDRTGLSALNVSWKPNPRSHSSFTFLVSLLLNLYSILIFCDLIYCTLNSSTWTFNFQISSQDENLFRPLCVVSFDNYITSSLTSSENYSRSDFMILSKSFNCYN